MSTSLPASSAYPAPKVLGRSRRLSFRLPPFDRPEGVYKVLGHRGARGTHPENTLSAFRFAWDAGCRVLETDIQVTADGVGICMHDDTLDRVTNLSGAVSEYEYADLKARARVYGGHGLEDSILRIEELIEEFPEAQLVIDVKTPRAIQELARIINSTRSAARICVTHNWDSWLEALRDMTSPLLQRNLGWETLAELVKAARTGVKPDPRIKVANWAHIAGSDSGLTLMDDPEFCQRFTDMAHDLGIGVRVWTVNDFSIMTRMWNQGVDAVFTDYPAQAIELIRNQQRWNSYGDILHS